MTNLSAIIADGVLQLAAVELEHAKSRLEVKRLVWIRAFPNARANDGDTDAHWRNVRGGATQASSGGKTRLGRISKAGQHDIRRLLIIGAMAAMVGACRRGVPEGTWLGKLMRRKPRILVAIALANKMARQIWAMLTKKQNYRDPALAAA
jgi:hypothetical protein